MQEESITFDPKNLFYNKEMQFSRSFSSLSIGALGGKLHILDAFSASGIRGIRYAKENKNVKRIDFLEANEEAVPVIKKNLKTNKLARSVVINALYEKYLASDFFHYDFIEIDPFGTPVPSLWGTFYGQAKKKSFYLSISATDVAVLCGPQAKACIKNYHAKSLNNEMTHEIGTRILIKRIMESANEFDFGIVPLYSLSNRHYIKVLLHIEKGAEKAYSNIEQLGFISYCNACGWRTSGKRVENNCLLCNDVTDYAGPLWLGGLHAKQILEGMKKLNEKRNYVHKQEIEKTLSLMLDEAAFSPCFYDLHRECKRIRAKKVPKLAMVIDSIRKRGFTTARTHFAENGVKTDAGIQEMHLLIDSLQTG